VRPAEIHVLHRSDFYQIRNYKCNCAECHTSTVEYTQTFNFCFVRSGYFEYRVFRKNLEVHVGRILVSKPEAEHVTRHIDNQPDVCSVFDFTHEFQQSLNDFYPNETQWFFGNRDLHSILLNCSPEIDYLHFQILNKTKGGQVENLLIDDWVMRLVDKVIRLFGNSTPPEPISSGLKKFHLVTIEKAKAFMLNNFERNISLQQLADHCCVSIFHFARLFKSIMRMTPYQYVSDLRLNHARVLLETTEQPVTQIAFQSGYNSLEHFATSFKQKFHTPPSAYRKVIL
jgi:AraC family transcriptional regulator